MKNKIFSITNAMLWVALISTALLIFAACQSDSHDYEEMHDYTEMESLIEYEIEEDEEEEEYEAAPEFNSSVPLDVTAMLFEQLNAIFDEDNGQLWGFPLHVPFVIADPVTRHAVANMPASGIFTRQGDVYVGILPAHVPISNTVRAFGGRLWGMAIWNEELFPEMDFLSLMVHEAFHVWQNQVVSGRPLGSFSRIDGEPLHMLEADARISVLLEINALLMALRSDGEARQAAIHDALSIRAYRRERFENVAAIENSLEINEGLATYTEQLVVGIHELLNQREHNLSNHTSSTSFNRWFAYFTGAMYALLLDIAGADWQNDLSYTTCLGGLLKEALGITHLTPFDRIDLELYGYAKIAPYQRAWAANFGNQLQSALYALVEQPTIRLDRDPVIVWSESIFNHHHIPEEILLINGSVTVRSADWHLEVLNGYVGLTFIFPRKIRLPACLDIEIDEGAMRAVSPNWILEITNDALQIVPSGLNDGIIRIVRR